MTLRARLDAIRSMVEEIMSEGRPAMIMPSWSEGFIVRHPHRCIMRYVTPL